MCAFFIAHPRAERAPFDRFAATSPIKGGRKSIVATDRNPSPLAGEVSAKLTEGLLSVWAMGRSGNSVKE